MDKEQMDAYKDLLKKEAIAKASLKATNIPEEKASDSTKLPHTTPLANGKTKEEEKYDFIKDIENSYKSYFNELEESDKFSYVEKLADIVEKEFKYDWDISEMRAKLALAPVQYLEEFRSLYNDKNRIYSFYEKYRKHIWDYLAVAAAEYRSIWDFIDRSEILNKVNDEGEFIRKITIMAVASAILCSDKPNYINDLIESAYENSKNLELQKYLSDMDEEQRTMYKIYGKDESNESNFLDEDDDDDGDDNGDIAF